MLSKETASHLPNNSQYDSWIQERPKWLKSRNIKNYFNGRIFGSCYYSAFTHGTKTKLHGVMPWK